MDADQGEFISINEAKINLCQLLCCNIEELTIDNLRKLIKKRYRLWHPDKNVDNPDRYRENFIMLNKSWESYKRVFEYNLNCDEQLSSSDDDDSYNSTPFDDDFFHASPKKEFAVPEYFRMFFRSASNRRAGKMFMIFCLQDHKENIDKFYYLNNKVTFFGVWIARTNRDICVILVDYVNDWRMVDIKKDLRKSNLSKTQIFYAVKFKKLIKETIDKLGQPFLKHGVMPEFDAKEESNKHFRHELIVRYALEHEIKEVLELMYEYAHLALPCDRPDANREHEEDHELHIENAKIYVTLCDRKKVAKNAIDAVYAKLYQQLKQLSNLTFLEMRSREIGNKLIENNADDIIGQAYYYYKYVFSPEALNTICKPIIESFIFGQPKKRWNVLKGPFGCGKSTFAAGFLKLFDGVTINVNVDRNRLPFYLGSAIGKRFVLMDDVKGRRSLFGLCPGAGFDNLDDLRDYMDGHIDVQLEKKNQNPVNQKFPCGIITCNEYIIPVALRERLIVHNFPQCLLYNVHHYPVTMETIFCACVFLNLIPVESHVLRHLMTIQSRWTMEHSENCDCMKQTVS